jgi:hypothetical protein
MTNYRSWCQASSNSSGRDCCCVTVDGPPPIRPDLAIYSQDEQIALGVAPTWNSPDMVTNMMNPLRLLPEIGVAVKNLSLRAAAINGQVSLYISEFGLGMPQSLVSSQVINLGPSQQALLQFPLSQSVLAQADQRIGTYVRIDHPYDSTPNNNSGAQLIAEASTRVMGRAFSVTFPVRNPLDSPQQITLDVLPNALGAAITPAVRAFAPQEQIVATLAIQVPAATHGAPGAEVQSDVTVIARGAAGELIGGLTYLVWIDD